MTLGHSLLFYGKFFFVSRPFLLYLNVFYHKQTYILWLFLFCSSKFHATLWVPSHSLFSFACHVMVSFLYITVASTIPSHFFGNQKIIVSVTYYSLLMALSLLHNHQSFLFGLSEPFILALKGLLFHADCYSFNYMINTFCPFVVHQEPFPMGTNIRARSGRSRASSGEESHQDISITSVNCDTSTNGVDTTGPAKD